MLTPADCAYRVSGTRDCIWVSHIMLAQPSRQWPPGLPPRRGKDSLDTSVVCAVDGDGAECLPRATEARQVFTRRAPSKAPKETALPFYQKGNVRIRYESVGSGFPLLVTPGGGLNSRVSNWPTAVFNAMEAFKNDFRCRARPDFVYSVSREFVRSCQTPMLVMPDDTPAHPYQT